MTDDCLCAVTPANRKLGRSIDAVQDRGLGAAEILKPLAVFVGELNREFEVRAMKAGVRIDRPAAAPEYALK